MNEYLFSGGVAYVCIPNDMDRAEYIKTCLSTSTVNVYSESSSYMKRVPVTQQVLDKLEFPDSINTYGTAVVWILDEHGNSPIIIGTLNRPEELGEIVEKQFKYKKTYGESLVEISGSPKDGALNLILNTTDKAEFTINISNKSDNAVANINVSGDVNVYTKNSYVESRESNIIKTVDEENEEAFASLEQNSEDHAFYNERFLIRSRKQTNSEQAMILGETFKQLFDNFIDEVARTTVTTALGQMPILNAAQVSSFKKQTQTILSKIGFLE